MVQPTIQLFTVDCPAKETVVNWGLSSHQYFCKLWIVYTNDTVVNCGLSSKRYSSLLCIVYPTIHFFTLDCPAKYTVVNCRLSSQRNSRKLDEKPKCSTCNAVADIIFVYDTSGSIGNQNDPTNFNIMKEFMIDIVDLFNPVGATGTQFAALCFSTIPKTHFYLNENNNEPDPKQATKDDIQAFPTGPNENTAIGDALKAVSTEFLTTANGIGRPCAQCFVILITDGKSNHGSDPVVEADKLRTEKNCIVFVVPIGLSNNAQMLAIAGGQVNNVFSVDNFNELNTVVQGIVQAACSNSACTTKPDNNGGYSDNHKKSYSHGGVNTIMIPVPVPIMIPASYPKYLNQKNNLKDLISRHGYGYNNKPKPSPQHYAYPGRYKK
ncbi:COL6A [Mytilus coruscus]|uniref:COL6A n=1 Tax=Mytilus coruscus TaxID=42192 RepID=A0A6J8D342_MYTCO|nr:COL6A [Mytilus coruscus]